jgi:molybdate transport system ATP-binding protein
MSGIELQIAKTLSQFKLDVNLVLPGQGVSAIVGASGSGKSTLLRCIAGLDAPHTGRIVVNGECWLDSETQHCVPVHRRSIGYVFQDANLFSHLTVRGNLDYGWKRITAAKRRVSYDEAVDLLGISALLERYPTRLSGGERQRVAIARALLTSPSLLLFDEPLSALDERSKSDILPCLERLHQELSIPMIYVSHAVREVARLADYLVSLQAGRVLAQGPLMEQMARLDGPFAADFDHGCVIAGHISAHDEDDHLSTFEFPGGQLLIAQSALTPGQQVRVYIPAADVSVTLSKPVDSSILNILPATIDAIVPQGASQWLLRLSLGENTHTVLLLARITRRSGRQLALHAGKKVFVQIKSVSLMRAQR